MPKIENRPEQAYVGKRVIIRMGELDVKVPELMDEMLARLDQSGIVPKGRPFLRYHVIDMPDQMDIEVAVPVDDAPQTMAGVGRGTLPAGCYATLTFTGIRNGVAANKRLIDWIANEGEEMIFHKSKNGDAFESRYETLLTDAKAEPDQSKWETEVAIQLRD